MKLLQQILKELGGDDGRAFTVIPYFGAYFKGVREVAEYSPQKITLLARKTTVTIEGENLVIDRYFEDDLFIKGRVEAVRID